MILRILLLYIFTGAYIANTTVSNSDDIRYIKVMVMGKQAACLFIHCLTDNRGNSNMRHITQRTIRDMCFRFLSMGLKVSKISDIRDIVYISDLRGVDCVNFSVHYKGVEGYVLLVW